MPPPPQDSWDSKAITVSRGRGFGPWYSIMRWIGRRCASHFFESVSVIGGEDVPAEGPFILVCTHFSTIMDVAIISAHLPHNRPIHYWAKKGLYRGKTFAWILNNSGNIQVDRQSKNNQDLFKGTFDAMEAGEAIGLFPEGGSYTEPRLHSIKAGAAWAALEYAKFLADNEAAGDEIVKTGVKIVPASINYTEKSRFRSKAVFQMGKAFSVDDFTEQFLSASSLSDDDGAAIKSEKGSAPYSAPQTPGTAGVSDVEGTSYLSAGSSTGVLSSADTTLARITMSRNGSARGATRRGDVGAKAAVQKLTDRISRELNDITINAPDWRTWHAMKVARELFWQGQSKGQRKRGSADLDVANIVPISNALLALFVDDDRVLPLKQSVVACDLLVRLQALQLAARTDFGTLNRIAPSISERNYSFPTPSQTVRGLLSNVVLLALKAPLYAPVAAFYAPAYATGWYMSSKFAKHEEESMASVKCLTGFPLAFIAHAILLLVVSALFLFTPPGILLGLVLSTLIRLAAERLVLSDGYTHLKLITAYGRCFLIHFGVIKNLRGQEKELDVMVRAVEGAQPVQWTLTKAFRRGTAGGRGSGNNAEGAPAAYATDSSPSPSPSSTPSRPLRRPAPIRCLHLALVTRREAMAALRDLVRVVRDSPAIAPGEASEGPTQRQREAWRFLEANGARLV